MNDANHTVMQTISSGQSQPQTSSKTSGGASDDQA